MNHDTRIPLITVDDERGEEIVLDNANASEKNLHGFHLVKSKWDPYPWIESVDSDSSAEISGLRSGDCLLSIDGRDILGLEMKEIGNLIVNQNDSVCLSVWRRPLNIKINKDIDDDKLSEINNDTVLEGPLPKVAQKLIKAISGVVKALECPICLESAAPPVSQCVHGHLLCYDCRLKTARCPVCRVRLGQGRCLLADKSHRVLTETLVKNEDNNRTNLHDSIFGSSIVKRAKSLDRRNERYLLSKVLSERNKLDESDASTESLPTSSSTKQNNKSCNKKNNWFLHLYDKHKSASTSELRSDNYSSSSLLSVPQTPTWGGSTESITSTTTKIYCPLQKRTGCRESRLSNNTILEHINDSHGGPVVHFFTSKFRLPLPFPFQEDKVIYVIHHKNQIFFMQNEGEKLWISNTELNCGLNWKWTIKGTKLNSVKEVVSLQETSELLPQYFVTISENHFHQLVNISLIESKKSDGFIDV